MQMDSGFSEERERLDVLLMLDDFKGWWGEMCRCRLARLARRVHKARLDRLDRKVFPVRLRRRAASALKSADGAIAWAEQFAAPAADCH